MARLIAALLFTAGLTGAAYAQSNPYQQVTVAAPQDITVNMVGTGITAVTVQATGGATLTTSFQVSDDGTNYIAQSGNPLPTGSPVSSTTAGGYWIFNVAGHKYFRVHTTAITGTEIFTVVGSGGGSSGQGSGGGGSTVGSTIIGADVVTLPGGSAITMFNAAHCANGCRISVPVAFCTNPLTTATATATTGGNECWQPNQSVAMPPTSHAISVFSTSASTASGIGSTIP